MVGILKLHAKIIMSTVNLSVGIPIGSYFDIASSHSSDSLSGLASGLGNETNRSHSDILDIALAKFTGRRGRASVSTTSIGSSGFLQDYSS